MLHRVILMMQVSHRSICNRLSVSSPTPKIAERTLNSNPVQNLSLLPSSTRMASSVLVCVIVTSWYRRYRTDSEWKVTECFRWTFCQVYGMSLLFELNLHIWEQNENQLNNCGERVSVFFNNMRVIELCTSHNLFPNLFDISVPSLTQ